ncbi:MAG: hypothetical protein ACKOW3_08670 [Hyphomicrobium sp.]
MQTKFLTLPLFFPLALFLGCSSAQNPTLPDFGKAGPPPNTGAVKPATELLLGPLPVGTPTEIYTRVARGILKCWFGANGPLKTDYKFYADADPPSKGGGSQISIHTKDYSTTDPRSIRAWRVGIVPGPDGTTLQIENIKLLAVVAEDLEKNVRRWGAAEEGCFEHTPSLSNAHTNTHTEKDLIKKQPPLQPKTKASPPKSPKASPPKTSKALPPKTSTTTPP